MAETRGGRFPVKGRTLSDYHVRVERVVDLMRQEPAQQFTLRELAGEAAFSEFHFHRIFRKVAGETVAKCHVRLRLEAAAEALAYDRDASVTDVALDCGYSNGASFSKAFRKRYGCSPTEFRQRHTAGFRIRKTGKARLDAKVYREPMNVDVEIERVPDRNVASLRLVGPYEHTGISRLFSELQDWHQATFGRPAPEEAIGITWSDSALSNRETWRFDACYEVPEGTRGAGRVMMRTLAGGWVACRSLSLPVSQLHQISRHWDWLISAWLPSVRAELANRPAYETYRRRAGEETFDITLCLPVKQKPTGA